MANFPPLTYQSGSSGMRALQSDQGLIVGNGITAAAGLTNTAGVGTNASGATPGTAGGVWSSTAGVGGAAAGSTGAGGAGGAATYKGGVGGAGTATGVAGAGGDLTLSSGAAGANGGAGGANSGNVTLDAGAKSGAGTDGTLSIGATNANAITIGRTGKVVTVAGDLTVSGTTTTINSTNLDVQDRLIRANKTTGTVAVPTAICGVSIMRGNDGAADRDAAGIFWDEGNSRWVFALNTGNDQSTVGVDQALKMGAITTSGNFTQSGSTTISTGTGVITVNGATAFTNVAVTATSAASFDLSGGSGVFKTTTGAITLGTGNITVSGKVAGDVQFLKEGNHIIDVGASTTTSTVGGNLSLSGAAGAPASGATAGSLGGAFIASGGTGGAAGGGAGAGGAGGGMEIYGGDGGAGTATGVAGAGSSVTISGGDAGTAGAAGGANGGNVTVDGGLKTGSGTNGSVTVGGTNASSIGIGRSGITTSLTGTITVQASSTLGTTSSGNINLPQNANARFNIEGAATTAGVTAANLNTLTDTSNADALHTHSAVAAGNLVIAGLTTTGLAAGDFGYISANGVLSLTNSAAAASSRMHGCNVGTVGSMTVGGQVVAKFTTVGGSPSPGAPVFLANLADDTNAGAGKLTATAPTTGVVAEVGLCVNNSNYAGAKTTVVLLQPKAIIQL